MLATLLSISMDEARKHLRHGRGTGRQIHALLAEQTAPSTAPEESLGLSLGLGAGAHVGLPVTALASSGSAGLGSVDLELRLAPSTGDEPTAAFSDQAALLPAASGKEERPGAPGPALEPLAQEVGEGRHAMPERMRWGSSGVWGRKLAKEENLPQVEGHGGVGAASGQGHDGAIDNSWLQTSSALASSLSLPRRVCGKQLPNLHLRDSAHMVSQMKGIQTLRPQRSFSSENFSRMLTSHDGTCGTMLASASAKGPAQLLQHRLLTCATTAASSSGVDLSDLSGASGSAALMLPLRTLSGGPESHASSGKTSNLQREDASRRAAAPTLVGATKPPRLAAGGPSLQPSSVRDARHLSVNSASSLLALLGTASPAPVAGWSKSPDDQVRGLQSWQVPQDARQNARRKERSPSASGPSRQANEGPSVTVGVPEEPPNRKRPKLSEPDEGGHTAAIANDQTKQGFFTHRRDKEGHGWKKYSHKVLQGSTCERLYYSCEEKEKTGCKARKIVDRPKVRHWRGDSVRDLVTIEGEHNHPPRREKDEDS